MIRPSIRVPQGCRRATFQCPSLDARLRSPQAAVTALPGVDTAPRRLERSAVGFFDDAPRHDDSLRGRQGRPWEPPPAEFPCAVAAAPLGVARTEKVAVAVIGLWAFKIGFEFWVSARFHHTQPPVSGDMAPQESVHIGLQFADGRKAANFSPGAAAAPGAEPDVALLPIGLGGGRCYRSWSYWVWPLPPPGPVTFVYEWPAAGIGEVRASLDARLILEAAAHSVRLWPGGQD